jgi:hypothetical protein
LALVALVAQALRIQVIVEQMVLIQRFQQLQVSVAEETQVVTVVPVVAVSILYLLLVLEQQVKVLMVELQFNPRRIHQDLVVEQVLRVQMLV